MDPICQKRNIDGSEEEPSQNLSLEQNHKDDKDCNADKDSWDIFLVDTSGFNRSFFQDSISL